MRIGLVMDASCDLPQAYVKQHEITVLPIQIDVDGETFADRRDDVEMQRFLGEGLVKRSHAAHTEPLSVDAVEKLFLDELVTRYDCVFCLTITAARSPIHANTTEASYVILRDYHAARQAAGLRGPFLMRVVDTQSLFTGAAVVVVEAVRLLAQELPPAQIRERLLQVAQNAYGYMLPRDLHYLRARGRTKGDRSVGLIGATLGSALDIKPIVRGWRGQTNPVAKMRGFDAGSEALFKHTAERVRDGLMVPVVTLSYGGNLEDMRALPGYEQVPQACRDCGVELLESTMSITGMVNVGGEALAVGFACEEYDASF